MKPPVNKKQNLMPSPHHFVKKIRRKDDNFFLECYTSRENYDRIKEILCVGTSVQKCIHRKTLGDNGKVDYLVTLPTDIDTECDFFIVLEDNVKKRVWKPWKELDRSSIPDEFYFNNRFLNLTYCDSKEQIKLNREKIANNIEPVLTKITYNNKKIHLSGYLFIPTTITDKPDSATLHVIKFREEDIRHSFSVRTDTVDRGKKIISCFTKHDYIKFLQRDVLTFSCSIHLEKIKQFHGYFNLIIEYNNYFSSVKNYYKRLEKRDHCYPIQLPFFRKSLFVPYCDDVVNTWRLDIYNVSWIEWVKLRVLFRQSAKNKSPRDPNIWLIGEYNNTARDNGMHFYHYLRKVHPSINAYYVIYGDSPDKDNLRDKHVISYGSYKHFKLAAQAKVLVFSHYPNYLVPKLNTIVNFRDKYKAFHTIFIQHGIIATTASVLSMRKKLREYKKFVVSSALEKKNICKYLGYDEKEVIITGLARWDNLLAISKKSQDILIMPTWRNNLENVTQSIFKQSNYYKFWNKLLSNEHFLRRIRQNDIKVNFFLHIGLARFAHCFEIPPEINQVTGKNIQKLLSSCGLLVTDYSSVAFDILFLDKPVIFCPFDYDEMMELRKGPQFINYEKDLPGPVCYDLDSTILEIIKCIEKNYTTDVTYRERRRKFFNRIDNHNCDRLFKEINALIHETPH